MNPSIDTTDELEKLRAELAGRDAQVRDLEARRVSEQEESRLLMHRLSLEARDRFTEQESALGSARAEMNVLRGHVAKTEAELTLVLAKLQQSQRESAEIAVQARSLLNDYMWYFQQDIHHPAMGIFSHLLSLKRFRFRKFAEKLHGSAYFDAEWYLSRNPDVAKAGMDPALHFIEHGFQEGRAPNARFEEAR